MFLFSKRFAILAFAIGSFQLFADCASEGNGFTSEQGGCYNANQDLVWSDDNVAAGINATANYSQANNYCLNLVEGGFSDWRLPTAAEFTQVALDNGADYLDYGYFATNLRWTSTFGTGANRRRVRAVSLETGGSSLVSQSSSLFVICVR
jgi:hypothetical protein